MGQIGGPTQAVAVQGAYAYIGVGLRLIVVDIANPANPKELGATESFGWYVGGVAVVGSTAFVAVGGAGLSVVDISDPAHPVTVGAYNTPGYAEGVAVMGNHAYVADGPAGLRILDITDQTHPVEAATAYRSNYAFDIAVEGRYAYIATAGAGLLVADMSDPAKPREIGSLDTPGYAYGLAVVGSTAYVADGWGGLRVVDVSVPSSSAEVGYIDTPGWAFDVAVRDGVAYVADGWGGVLLLDVKNLTKITQLGSYNPAGGLAMGLVADSKALYVADRAAGLRVLDVQNTTRPLQVSMYGPMGYADGVAVAGDFAYVAAGTDGLRVVDIADPTQPRQVGAYQTNAYATGVVIQGNYAYVITYSSAEAKAGVHVVDVSKPTHPVRVSFLAILGMPQDMVIRGQIAYIADEWGIRLIDVSNQSSPVEVGFLDFAGGDDAKATNATRGVDALGELAYVAYQDSGLKIVDVSNPRKPSIVGIYKTATVKKVMSVVVDGKYAYVTDIPRMHVVDISDPRNPTEAGFYDLPQRAERVAIAEGTIYTASGAAGLVALDVTDPASPMLIGRESLPGYALGLTVAGSQVYVADGEGGLFILEDIRRTGSVSASASQQDTSKREQDTSLHGLAAYGGATTLPSAVSGASPQDEVSAQSMSLPFVSSTWPYLSGLDSFVMARTWTVTSPADSGPGTLRDALEKAQSGDSIVFDPAIFPPASPTTISLASALPGLRQGNITIDASNAGVVLDGSKTPPGTPGMMVVSDQNSIRGLHIIGFSDGVVISGSHNTVGGDRKKGNGLLGQGNLISGNGFGGVDIKGTSATGNRIVGNLIGTDHTSKQALGKQNTGVFVGGGSANVIGGPTEPERNVISGNSRAEVSFMSQATGNEVIGNHIGTDSSGRTSLGNAVMGVSMELGAFGNLVRSNVICNNGSTAVMLSDWGTWGNDVIGNFIGVDATGTIPLGCAGNGIIVNASFNRVGGTAPGERNVVSGNGDQGLSIGLQGTTGVVVIGNYIGTDSSGTKVLANYRLGISLVEGANHTFIGGSTKAERNLISGNRGGGIELDQVGVRYNFIVGNHVGAGVSGTESVPNEFGVHIGGGDHNFVQINLIAFNRGEGVTIAIFKGNSKPGDGNQVHHNSFVGNYWSDYKGTDASGDGIGDTPHPVLPNGADRYPLMARFE